MMSFGWTVEVEKYGKTSTEEQQKKWQIFSSPFRNDQSPIDNSFCIWNEESNKLETTEDEKKN